MPCSKLFWSLDQSFLFPALAHPPSGLLLHLFESHCRGLKRNTSAPKRARSWRLAPVAISSIPQQAVANGIGHRLFLRHQLANSSSLLTTTFSGTSIAIGIPLCARRTQILPPTAQ